MLILAISAIQIATIQEFEFLQSWFFKLVTWEDITGSNDGETQILNFGTILTTFT